MQKKYLAIAALLAAVPCTAQESVDAVVACILENNRALVAADLGVRADLLDKSDENALADPSVAFSRVWGKDHIGNKLQLDITQEFDWPGVYGARRSAADAAVDAGKMANRAAALDIEMQARSLLNELIYVRRQLEVLTELQDGVQQLSAAIDRGVKGGEITVLDQRKTAISVYEIENEIGGVRARECEIIARLNGMSGPELDLSDITAYPVQPLLSLPEYLERVFTDPSFMAQTLTARSEEEAARVATMSRFPGFTVGYQHQSEMGDHFNGFSVGMNLPVFQGRKAKAAATLRHLSAFTQAMSTFDALKSEIEGAYSTLDIQRGRLEAYNRTFGDNQYLNLLRRAYEGGEMTVLEYLQEAHYYHQTMLTYLETEYQYHQALTTLNRVCYAYDYY